jgi:hypothetical protein
VTQLDLTGVPTFFGNIPDGILTADGTLVVIGRTGGEASRFEKVIVVRDCVATAGTAAAYDLPLATDLATVPKSFGGSLWAFPDGRVGFVRAYYAGAGGPNRIVYNEMAFRGAQGTAGGIVPDVMGCDAAGNFSGLLRGAAGHTGALLLWDAEASQIGYEWAREKTVTTTGGRQGGIASQQLGYRRAFVETANTDRIVIGAAADWGDLHKGVLEYYVLLAGYMPNISANTNLLSTNNGALANAGIRIYAVNATNQVRLDINKGDNVNLHTHSVTVLTRNAPFLWLWHVSAARTIFTNGNGQNRSTSVQAVSLVHGTANGPGGLVLGNFSASGNEGFAGLKITDAVILPGAYSQTTQNRLFAWAGRGKQ